LKEKYKVVSSAAVCSLSPEKIELFSYTLQITFI